MRYEEGPEPEADERDTDDCPEEEKEEGKGDCPKR